MHPKTAFCSWRTVVYFRYVYTLKKTLSFTTVTLNGSSNKHKNYIKNIYRISYIVRVALRTLCEVLIDSTANFEATFHYLLAIFVNFCLFV